ncbi:hypothetical protein [Caballeronia sp. S22]|uniref:hypothetical protein n=1 Tax=Caballeronia sp. S22 TaxID=3137182 RepID=UPI003531115C
MANIIDAVFRAFEASHGVGSVNVFVVGLQQNPSEQDYPRAVYLQGSLGYRGPLKRLPHPGKPPAPEPAELYSEPAGNPGAVTWEDNSNGMQFDGKQTSKVGVTITETPPVLNITFAFGAGLKIPLTADSATGIMTGNAQEMLYSMAFSPLISPIQ